MKEVNGEKVLEQVCIFDLCDGQARKNYFADIYKTAKGYYLSVYNPDAKIWVGVYNLYRLASIEYQKYAKNGGITITEFNNLHKKHTKV